MRVDEMMEEMVRHGEISLYSGIQLFTKKVYWHCKFEAADGTGCKLVLGNNHKDNFATVEQAVLDVYGKFKAAQAASSPNLKSLGDGRA